MSEYHADEAVFELEGPWIDRTVHALTLDLEGGDKIGFTLGREVAPPGATLEDLVTRSLTEQRRLTGFELIEKDDTVTVGGLPAMRLRTQWRMSDGPVYHLHTYVIYFDKLLVFSGTAKWQHRHECDRLVERTLSSVIFRERRT